MEEFRSSNKFQPRPTLTIFYFLVLCFLLFNLLIFPLDDFSFNMWLTLTHLLTQLILSPWSITQLLQTEWVIITSCVCIEPLCIHYSISHCILNIVMHLFHVSEPSTLTLYRHHLTHTTGSSLTTETIPYPISPKGPSTLETLSNLSVFSFFMTYQCLE